MYVFQHCCLARSTNILSIHCPYNNIAGGNSITCIYFILKCRSQSWCIYKFHVQFGLDINTCLRVAFNNSVFI